MRIDHSDAGRVASNGQRWLWMALPLTVLMLVLFSESSGAQSSGTSACVSDIGTLSATTSSVSVSGSITADPGCTSPQRDPLSSASFYARRHTFALSTASVVSVGTSAPGVDVANLSVLLLEGSSSDGNGTVLGIHDAGHLSSLAHLSLPAGTYTIEVTTHYAEFTSEYELTVDRWDVDACVRDWGILSAAVPSASVQGMVVQDSSCVSSRGDVWYPKTYWSGQHFARRHTFTLDASATVSVGAVGRHPYPRGFRLVLLEGSDIAGSGKTLARSDGDAEGLMTLDRELQAGTYTVEVTTQSARRTGGYSVWVRRWSEDACIRDLGVLDDVAVAAWSSGRIGRDAACLSSRDGSTGSSVRYARRHTFTLEASSTVLVSASGSDPESPEPRLALLEGASADGSGRVLYRAGPTGDREPASGGHLALAAGIYTAEVTGAGPGRPGGYRLWVRRWAADACVRDLGGLEGTTTWVSGIVAADASCVSSQRDPGGSSVFYARRHTFTLNEAAAVSASATSRHPDRRQLHVLLLEGSSADGSGRVVYRSVSPGASAADAPSHLVLAAGTYTAEVTFAGAEHTGAYGLAVERREVQPCASDLGSLDGTRRLVSASGIVAADASCVSSQREPDDPSVFHARRHTFTLGEASTVSVGVLRGAPGHRELGLLLLNGSSADGTGKVLRRVVSDGGGGDAWLDRVSLGAGTYTAEVTTAEAGDSSGYLLWVGRWEADGCVTDLGVLDSAKPQATQWGLFSYGAACVSSGTTRATSARRHTFTVNSDAVVSLSVKPRHISLQSPVLGLIAGSGPDGTAIALPSDAARSRAPDMHVALSPGTYTVEVTDPSSGSSGVYQLAARRSAAEPCTRDHGTLDAAADSSRVGGIVAMDASCVGPQRESRYDFTRYAHRHTFTLTERSAVSMSWAGSVRTVDGLTFRSAQLGGVLLRNEGASESDTVVDSVQSDWSASISRALPAGTYTLELASEPWTQSHGGEYSLWLQWWDSDDCVHQIGTLPRGFNQASFGGIVATGTSCATRPVPAQGSEVFDVRRHIFALDEQATISPYSYGRFDLVLLEGSWPRGGGPVIASTLIDFSPVLHNLDGLRLEPGTYTAEVIAARPEGVGTYALHLRRVPTQQLVAVTDATAREDDGEIVFTVSVERPDGGALDGGTVTVRWATASGTAEARSDYRAWNGGVTIPAGSRRATVSVPLLDDADAETGESFGVQLFSTQGAVLADGYAEATIIDDDPASSAPVPLASTCTNAQVTGLVGDVFDVTQWQYQQWTDVFVDVELSCEGGSAGSGGYRTGVAVLHGPRRAAFEPLVCARRRVAGD